MSRTSTHVLTSRCPGRHTPSTPFPETGSTAPGLSSDAGLAKVLLHQRHQDSYPWPVLPSHCSTEAPWLYTGTLPFYGRKMNCLLGSEAQRDDRTESCHLLWFWQQEKSVFPSATPGWTVHMRHSLREKQNPQPNCSQMQSSLALPV